MAKDDDELIRKFRALTSYLPVFRPAPTLTRPLPPPWAIEIGVEQPAPPLTGLRPPWPIGVAITSEMHKVCDWLEQHHDQRDTDEYRCMHNWLAEQMGLSPDTLEPLGSSSRALPPATSPPIEQTAEPAPLAEFDASETAAKPESTPPVDPPLATAVSPAQPSAKKRVTCASWVADVVKAHPRPEGCENYAEYLLPFRPQNKTWSERTISNELVRQGLTHYRKDPAHKATHKSAHTAHKSAHEKPAKS